MRNKCHQELAKLVAATNPTIFRDDTLQTLIQSSIEPDETNKQRIMENILDALTIPVEWLVNHTVRAKELTIRCVWNAYEMRRKKNSTWLQYLGWAFHYIADWGTPHHSPVSKSNPVPAMTGIGAIIGGVLGGFSKAGEGLGEVLKGVAKGALMGAGISGVAGIVGLVIEHNEFEIKCDARWDDNSNLIKDKFFKLKEQYIPSNEIGVAFKNLENLLDDLRSECNYLPPDWISQSSTTEYSDYMVKIAIIMHFVFQMVVS
jgi:hypothetical protein